MSLPVVAKPETLAVIDAEYREIAVRPHQRASRLRSVVLPAGLTALAIFAPLIALFAVIAWSSP